MVFWAKIDFYIKKGVGMNTSLGKYQALIRTLGGDLVRGFEVKNGINLSAVVTEFSKLEQQGRELKRFYMAAFIFCSMFLAMLFASDVWGSDSSALKVCGFLFVFLVILLVRAFFLDRQPLKESREGARKLFARVQELMSMLNPLNANEVHYNERWLFNTLVVIASELLKVETRMAKKPIESLIEETSDLFELEVEKFRLCAKYAHLSLAAKEFGISFDQDDVFNNATRVYATDLWIVVWTKREAQDAVSQFASIIPPLVE